jgi:hypothetical protein
MRYKQIRKEYDMVNNEHGPCGESGYSPHKGHAIYHLLKAIQDISS